jgi:hypothetical protein
MASPESDGMLDPALRIRAHAQAEAMTGIPEPAVFDLDSGISQILDAPLHGRHIRDPIIRTDRDECRREILRV